MKRTFLAAALLLLAGAVACEKESKVEDAVTLKSNAAVTIPVEGDIVSISFNASVAWEAVSSESWLTLTPAKGEAGDATVKASALKNENNEDRAATVTIKAGSASASVTVTQSQLNALNIAVTEYEVEVEGGTVTVEVNANVAYTVTIPEAIDWVHVANAKGMEASTVTLTVDRSWETEARSANITISDGTLSSTVKITQAAFEPYFEFTGDWAGLQWSFYGTPTSIPQEGVEIVIDVETNIDWRVYMSYWNDEIGGAEERMDNGWAHLSYDVEKSQIVLKIDENDSYYTRTDYLYASCTINGEPTGEFGGTGMFVQEGKSAGGVAAELVWAKSLDDLGIPSAYNRLAYKTYNGPALLVSDGEKVHAMGPNNGAYYKAITWSGITPTSICSDDAGNVIVADHVAFSSGSTYSVYYATDVNATPSVLFTHTADFDGTIGSWRVTGDINDKAAVTGVVSMAAGNPAYWAGWEIKDKAVSLDNSYFAGSGGQHRGPAAGDGIGSPTFGAVMALGSTFADGVIYRGYDGTRDLQYLATASLPNWVTAYDWRDVATAGNGSNANQNNMDVITYNEKRIVAYTQGYHFSYTSDGQIYILDATDMNDVKPLLVIEPSEYIITDNDFTYQSSADVLLHAGDETLELFVVNSGKSTIAKFNLIIQ